MSPLRICIDINVNVPQMPAILDALGRLTDIYVKNLEAEVEKVKTALTRARKSIDKLRAQAAKSAEDKAAAAAAEEQEDAEHAAAVQALRDEIAALQERVANETITPEEQADLDALVAELDELDGEDEADPEPEPEPEPEPTPVLPVESEEV